MSPLLLFNQGFMGSSDWDPESVLAEEDRRIVTPDEFRSNVSLALATDLRFIRHLDEHPEELHRLTPRQFEELTGSVLERFGYDVTVTGKGRDGGVDVLAHRDTEVGTELLLVQCKHYAEDHKVGEPVVKQLLGDVTARNATRGLIVTTSTFTSVALRLIESVRYRLGAADQAKLREWIAQVCRS